MSFRQKYLLVFLLFFTAFLQNCSVKKPAENVKEKVAIVMADETFKPLCENMKMVFENSFKGSTVNIIYTSEANCFKNLTTDSIDVFITGRALNNNEMLFLKDSIGNIPNSKQVARDGLTFIVAKNSALNYVSIKKLITWANNKSEYSLIFEGLKSTSTLRIFTDSLLNGVLPINNISGAENAEEVIKKVRSDPSLIGVIGWQAIGDFNNNAQNKWRNMVKIMPVIDTRGPQRIVFAPNQQSFYDYTYPLIRGVYTITKGAPFTVGRNFAAFMANEQGQLIFKRAAIAPIIIDFSERKLRTN